MRLYEFFDQPREGMGFLGEKNVEEGDLDKFKKYIRPVVKTKPKIERTTNPAGRTNDHVEWKVTTPTGEIHRYKSKKQAQEHFDSFGSQGVVEVAPPGAKAERMVRHIKQGYAKDGKLTPKEKGIAFATAWKAHNAGQVEEDLSRRGFLKGAGAAATMAATGPEIATLVKGFAEKAGGLNGIQALKAMLKVATADELYNMYEYQADSGILDDAITHRDMVALDRVGYDNWSEFEEHCDKNGVDADDEFNRLTGKPLTVILVQDILEKIDNTWSLEDYFEQYPDALKIINPFENGSISMPTMQQLAKIDTAAKGANLPTPIVSMANAVAGLVRQIFKSNGQPLTAPQQVAQTSRAAPALSAPTKSEFDFTPDLKQKEKVPMRRKDNDQESKRSYVAVRHHQPASDPQSNEVEWDIVDNRGEFVRNFWDSNDQADADRVMNGMIQYMTALAPDSGLAKRGPFRAVRASIPGSTLDPQRPVDEQGVTEGSESGPVEAYGYRYNNRDQRIVWRKIFPSGEAAYAWADRNNATVLGTRSTEQR